MRFIRLSHQQWNQITNLLLASVSENNSRIFSLSHEPVIFKWWQGQWNCRSNVSYPHSKSDMVLVLSIWKRIQFLLLFSCFFLNNHQRAAHLSYRLTEWNKRNIKFIKPTYHAAYQISFWSKRTLWDDYEDEKTGFPMPLSSWMKAEVT